MLNHSSNEILSANLVLQTSYTKNLSQISTQTWNSSNFDLILFKVLNQD